jgi:hypothetical protein
MSWESQQRTAIEEPVPVPASPALATVMPASASPGPASLDSGSVLALQRSAGNAAVNRLMRQATLHRCSGDACCEACEEEREGEAEDEVERAERPAQDVQGQAEVGLHTPNLEAMAAAAAELPATAGAVPAPGAEEQKEGEAPVPPAQRALQRAIAQSARSRLVSRVATWTAGPVHEVNNLAAAVMNGTAAGVTWPTLNGTTFWSNGEVRGALAKPTVTTTAAASGFEAEVGSVPTNLGSYDETVLAAGPWTTVVARGTIAARFPTLAQCSASGDTTFRAIGDPSDAEMQAANRRHEDHHATDHRDAFNATILPWDTKLMSAKAAGTKFAGATAAEAEAALWAHMGGTPDQIADAFMARCAAAVVAYHGSAAGGPIGAPTDPQASGDCATSSAKYTNPS